MPSDPEHPEHPIDALLGAYADQRRKSAPAEPRLHPATRRMLQSEVRRLRPAGVSGSEPASPGRWARLLGWWPRVAVAGGLAVALTLIVWWTLPSLTGNQAHSGSMLMAKQVPPSRPLPSAPTPALAPAISAPEAPPAEPPMSQRPSLASSVDPASSMASAPAAAPIPALPAPAPSRARDGSEDVKLLRSEPAPSVASAPVADRVVRSVDPTMHRGMSTLGAGVGVGSETAPAVAPTAGPAVTRALAPASAPTPASVPAGAADATGAAVVSQREAGMVAGVVAKGEAGAEMVSRRAASAESVPRNAVATSGGAVQQGVFLNQGAVSGGDGRRPMGRRELAVDAVSAPGAGGVGMGAGAGVLARFSVEQQGSLLRLIDGDGSVYEGRLLELVATGPASGFVRAPAGEATRGGVAAPGGAGVGAVRAADGVADGGVGLRFEVTGTNRTLRSRVVFTGALQVMTNAMVGGLSAKPGLADGVTTLSSTPGAPLSAAPGQGGANSGIQRIQGRVQVGGTNRLDIDAVRVAP